MRLRLPAVGLCLALALPSAPAPAATQPGLDELMRVLAARKHGHVSFTEVHVLAMLDRPLISSGELVYDAPDSLEKRTLKPRAETVALTGSVLTIRRGEHTRRLELAQYPQVAPWIESIRATLAGDRAALERYFQLDFSGTLAHWSLLLVPTDRAAGTQIAAIHITGEGAALREFEIRQRDGDHSILKLGPEITP